MHRPSSTARLVPASVAIALVASLGLVVTRPAIGIASDATTPPASGPTVMSSAAAPTRSPSRAPAASVSPGPASPSPAAPSSPAPSAVGASPSRTDASRTADPAATVPTQTPEVIATAIGPRPYPGQCAAWSGTRARADGLLANRWALSAHPVVTLPADRAWNENPLGDANWQYLDHSLMVVHSLFATYAETAAVRYRDRGAAILRDWIADNPPSRPRSVWAWNDHSTAMRAVVLTCARPYLARSAWLEDALVLHGRTLADPDFYVNEGNHALNQALGLLEIGVTLQRADWRQLALDRMATLAAESIDSQGVTNEQAVGYQTYNWRRYTFARTRITQLGLPVPASFRRIGLMPSFLGHATLPNAEYEMIGDTDRVKAPAIKGTWAEFSATQGRSGPRPPDTVAVYRAGYLFARTGWGTARPFADETFMSLRFGPAPIIHGHPDGGAITYYGHGSRLLIDPGKYSYTWDPYRGWFKGRTAHNVVAVDGVAWDEKTATRLLHHSRSTTMVNAAVELGGNAGVTQTRNVTFSRRLGYILVDDRLSSTAWRTFRQLWHLTDDAAPYVRSTFFRTQRPRGNVEVRQLLGGTTSRTVTGRTSPIQGWVAWNHGVRVPAPVVEVARSGRTARYLTLISTAPGTPKSIVSNLRLTATGYSVDVTIGGRSERVVVSGKLASITSLP